MCPPFLSMVNGGMSPASPSAPAQPSPAREPHSPTRAPAETTKTGTRSQHTISRVFRQEFQVLRLQTGAAVRAACDRLATMRREAVTAGIMLTHVFKFSSPPRLFLSSPEAKHSPTALRHSLTHVPAQNSSPNHLKITGRAQAYLGNRPASTGHDEKDGGSERSLLYSLRRPFHWSAAPVTLPPSRLFIGLLRYVMAVLLPDWLAKSWVRADSQGSETRGNFAFLMASL